MIEKNKLRSNLKNLDYKNFALSEINIKFLNTLIHQKKVCTYIPNKMEININKYLVNFLELQTTYLVDEVLNICLLNEPFVENKYKIAEPAIKIPVTDTQVFLIPGLGFTKEGIRLGRGKGLYDKLLSKYSTALKIGICANKNLLDEIPMEEHDILMDYVLTENENFKIH